MLSQLCNKQKVPHSYLVFDYINVSNQYILPGYKILSWPGACVVISCYIICRTALHELKDCR